MFAKNKVIVNRLGFGRIGFDIDSECLKTLKEYTLKLKTALPSGETELTIRITIIEIKKIDECKYECRALYKKLTELQLLRIIEIIDYYAGNGIPLNKLTAVIY